MDDRLTTSLETLTASIEIKKPHLLEWEPEKHHMTAGIERSEEHVRWIVRDRENRLVDRSRNLENLPDLAAALAGTELESDDTGPADFHAADGTVWRFRSVRVQPLPIQSLEAGPSPGHKRIYSELVVTAALSMTPAEQELQALLLLLSIQCCR